MPKFEQLFYERNAHQAKEHLRTQIVGNSLALGAIQHKIFKKVAQFKEATSMNDNGSSGGTKSS